MKRAEMIYKGKLAQAGCLVCKRIHPHHEPASVELHHYRSGGWGKGDYTTLIPLCVAHHRGDTGVHGLGTKGFDAHYMDAHGFTQADLLADARQIANS